MKEIGFGIIGVILGLSLCVNGIFIYKILNAEPAPETESVVVVETPATD